MKVFEGILEKIMEEMNKIIKRENKMKRMLRKVEIDGKEEKGGKWSKSIGKMGKSGRKIKDLIERKMRKNLKKRKRKEIVDKKRNEIGMFMNDVEKEVKGGGIVERRELKSLDEEEKRGKRGEKIMDWIGDKVGKNKVDKKCLDMVEENKKEELRI